MATSTKFDSLSITAIRSNNIGKVAKAPAGGTLGGPLGPEPGPALPEYIGQLKYDISGDVHYTTKVIIIDGASDAAGFTNVYRELQSYVQSEFQLEKQAVLGNIRFTPTTVTIRFKYLSPFDSPFGSRINLRQTYSKLNGVEFSKISASFGALVQTFFQNIDDLSRGAAQTS
jgi:hypothetical protein